jgi:hypothetical protein
MKNKHYLFIAVLLLLSLILLFFILIPGWKQNKPAPMPGNFLEPDVFFNPDASLSPEVVNYDYGEIRVARETYLQSNISLLSPTKEVLGGKFYITGINWIGDDKAQINYEDGHIALLAEALFKTESTTEIISFVVIPEPVSVSKSENYQEGDVRALNVEAGMLISSPLEVTGEAKGNWFFEANIPVKLIDDSGQVVASIGGQAQTDWMTSDFVPFKATLKFATVASSGALIISKDNPSGLVENDAYIRIPVRLK